MPLNFDIDGDLLLLTVTGFWNRQASEEAQQEAARLVQQHNLRGILVDIRQAQLLVSTSDVFYMTTSHVDIFPRQFRHAVLVRPDPESEQHSRFYETVAANRALPQRAFFDRDEALAWLRGKAQD